MDKLPEFCQELCVDVKRCICPSCQYNIIPTNESNCRCEIWVDNASEKFKHIHERGFNVCSSYEEDWIRKLKYG